MIGVDAYSKDEAKGALIMTYSGSILSIGPMDDGERDVAYASIGVRRDVPQMLVNQSSRLGREVTVDDVVNFDEGPVAKTSPVYAIAVFTETLPPTSENAALVELTQALAERFVDINIETLHS